MRIKRVEVTNFRALRNSVLNFTNATALLGENNCGKSAFLLALDFFFASSPRLKDKDFSDGNTSEPIDITVHFGDLTPYDRDEFERNLLDGSLVITRRFAFNNPNESGKYFVSARVNPDFSECRNETGKSEKRRIYVTLREKYGNPPELPKEKNADEIDGFLEDWEARHPDGLKVAKVAAFKGWTNVAAGKLKQKTSYVLIRAVQDAAEDIQESKSSPVKNLIDTIARQTIENSADFKAFMGEANNRISQLTDPKNVPILADISHDLTTILSDYYRDSEIVATWAPITQLQPSFPSANIEVKDHEFLTGLDGVGHGLQRAVILTVLRFMAEHRAKAEGAGQEFAEPQSDLVVAIEEPEIYQHPTKQRLFGKLLPKLADGFNRQTGIRVQTIFATHSPLLISLAQCECIRLVRARSLGGKKNVNVNEISLDRCSRRSAEESGRKPEEAWSAAKFAGKLHTFDAEMAEGFFAKCVILVEGVGDKAILEAWYAVKERDPHAEGIVVAAASGKNNLSKPIIIFDELAIPCYWIFDNDKSDDKKDKNQSIKANRLLQRLGGIAPDKCADWPDGQYARFTCWDRKLEKYVSDRVGPDAFNRTSIEIAENYDIEPNNCLKFPASASTMLNKFYESGVTFKELDEIIESVDRLVGALG